MINIIEGFTKHILNEMGFTQPPKYALERMDICNQCPSKGPLSCNECGCYLEAKTLVKSETCPLNKWESQ